MDKGIVPASEGRALRATEHYHADQRDWTPEPPAMLDPLMVIKARRWLFYTDGWEKLHAQIERDLK